MQPKDDRLWQVALSHLEDQWPSRLQGLLLKGQLKTHLDQAVQDHWDAQERLQSQQQALPPEERLGPVEQQELLLPEFVAPPNPEHDPELPHPPQLNPKARSLLRLFKQEHKLR